MKKIFVTLFSFFLIFFSTAVHSAIILKIKGRKALVDLEGVVVKKGDKFDALNLYGKPLGVLQIKKVKKGKAIAVLVKGKMGVNWILEPVFQGSGAIEADEEYDPVDNLSGRSDTNISYKSSESFKKYSSSSSNGFGLIVGANYNSVATTANAQSISGIGVQGDIFMDLTLYAPLSMRLFVGYRQLKAVGSKCGLSRCSLLIHYPGAGLFLRGVFLKDLMAQPWVGAGGFLFWPIVDKQADLGLDKNSFSSFHGSLTAALGVDIHFDGFYLPIQVDANWVNLFVVSIRRLKENAREFKPFYIGAKLGVGFSF